MANQIQPVRLQNLEGGLNLADDTLIGDNQLSKATNVFYNSEKKLQTRYGQADYGQPVPDAVVVIHNCDSLAGNGTWAGTEDAVSAALEAAAMKRGAGAISFNVDVSNSANNYAILTNSTFTGVNISTAKGYIGFWLYAPAAATTDLTNLVFRLGSDATNYYEWTIATTAITNGAWRFIPLLFSDATTVLAPDDTGIDYAQLTLNYAAGYTDKTGFMIDDIAAYSATHTKPMMSLKYFEESITPFARHLITNAGTNVFEWDETSEYWNVIKTGVTDGARYTMSAYINIMYLSNGTDNYASWNGVTYTEHTGANTYKAKYLLVANDIAYALGDPSVPSSLAYTAATPANLQTYGNVLVLDEDSSDGVGTGLINLGPIVIASKEKKIYKVNVATPAREQIDYSNGALSDRCLTRVENEVFLLNDAGVYTLAQREGTTGSVRADSLSDDLKKLIDECDDKTTAAAYYNYRTKNFYLFFDENNDTKNEVCIVFSTHTKKWTKYNNVNANEAVVYKDSDRDEHFLIANSLVGQCIEIETGYTDNGTAIKHEVETKNFDFDSPETLKTFEMIEVFGFINSRGQLKVDAIIDDQDDILDATIEGADYVTVEGSEALGAFLLGSSALGGADAGSGVVMYPFKARIPMYSTGSRIKLRFWSQSAYSVWIITKAAVYPYAQPLEIFEENYIY